MIKGDENIRALSDEAFPSTKIFVKADRYTQ